MTGSLFANGPPCPENEALARLAAGVCSSEESEQLVEHAAGCMACAARLRDLVDAVADGESGEQPEFTPRAFSRRQRTQLAEQMALGAASFEVKSRTTRSRGPKIWMGLAAMLIIAAAFGGWTLLQRLNSPPFAELARAYSTHRTLALQIPGAANAPLAAERRGQTVTDLPAALLDSQSKIRKHLDAHPSDPAWLHAEGRAAVLLWDYDTALRSFQSAADLGEKSAPFYVDFASAYFERAESNGNALDYAAALEKLGTALQIEPANLPALFNRAVIRGLLYQYDPAATDFDEYIRRESDAGWREEAKQRLADLRKRRARVFDGGAPPKELAAEFALAAKMTGGLRDYLSHPESGTRVLAEELVRDYGDPWLAEVIKLSPSSQVTKAVVTLTSLARLRTAASSQYDAVADDVRVLESTNVPAPLRIWLGFELLYHRTRTMAVGKCPDSSDLEKASRRYPWLNAQILLDESLCAAGRQNFSEAMVLVAQADAVARVHHFEDTSIRVDNYRSQRYDDTGFYSEAVQAAVSALGRMERGGYPIRRAYDFHVIFVRAATQLNLPNAAIGAATMMVSVSRAAGTQVFEMIGDSQVAQLNLMLGRKDDAARNYDAAHGVFARLGENSEAAVYWRVIQSSWLEMHRDRDGLYRILSDARRQAPTGGSGLYFTRRIVAALCRLELIEHHPEAVEGLANAFWREAAQSLESRPTEARAYLAEVESVAQSLTSARLMAGRPDQALAAWQHYITLDERLLGAREPSNGNSPLSPGAATLTIANLDNRPALWLSTRSGVAFHWADGSWSELVARVRRLRRLCSLGTATQAQIAEEARAVFLTLFPSGTAGANRIGIEASGELNTLPLSIFLLVDEGKNVNFSFLPFGGEVVSEGQKPVNITTIAATVFDSQLASVGNIAPSLREEAEAAGALFVDRRSLQGYAATVRAMETAALSPGILHFAGHAISWHGSVGLLVAPDPGDNESAGRLGIWQMSRPRSIRSDLVVFSACSTANFNDPGSVRPGQLTEAALLAGAKEVVASSWDVDSDATTAWMRRFYQHISAGEPTSNAVRMTALEMRAISRWNQPRYWAAFSDYARSEKRPLLKPALYWVN